MSVHPFTSYRPAMDIVNIPVLDQDFDYFEYKITDNKEEKELVYEC